MEMSVHMLPPELLIDIFIYTCWAGAPFAPLVICAVCKLWRDVCVASPRIWQLIIVNDSYRRISSIKAHADLWIARSDPLPFSVDVELTDFERILPIVSCFLPHLHRWMDCRISFDGRTTHTRLSDLTPSAPRRVLHHLDVHLKTPFDTNGSDDDRIFFSCGTSFRHISMKVAASSLPSPNSINSLYFTSLDITESSFTHTVRSPELLSFLLRCPNLEHFYLHGVSSESEEGILSTPHTIVTLPRLHTLFLGVICIQRSILSHLHLPALRELRLHHLNMDVSLDGYHTEEHGDSDDEADDFSQSPSSDHQTGMGLRKLIQRSRPPLEILDMDLSDMRTKDFTWVFDRLPHLKQFSIVGSDMSDKVVQLFKPVRVQAAPGTTDHYRVRLPRLTTLKLFGCQQFSGEALVEALSARVAHTDVATPHETLTNVVVSGCPNFTTNDGSQLASLLHGRLHLS